MNHTVHLTSTTAAIVVTRFRATTKSNSTLLFCSVENVFEVDPNRIITKQVRTGMGF